MTKRVPAVERAVAVLDLLASRPNEAFTLSQLARDLDLNKATAHALLLTMSELGYLTRDETTKSYALGPALIAVGAAAAASYPAARVAQPAMNDLSRRFDLEVVASTALTDEILILSRAGTPRPLGINIQPGQRLPLVPPLGTVFIAWAGEQAIDRWLGKLGPNATEDDLSRYRAALEAVRTVGVSLALGGEGQQRLVEELTAGADGSAGAEYALTELSSEEAYPISQIGAPVFGPNGEVALGLFLIGFRGQLPASAVPEYVEALKDAAASVTARLHGHAPLA